MKTYSMKLGEIDKKWFVIDATDLVLGRLASQVAKILRGKHKATFTPHMDCGDNVIIINAEKVALTGKKLTDKVFYWHTGYVGGVKEITPEKQLAGKFPERLIERAVKRMITRSPLGDKQMTHLKIYAGPEHPHEGLNPVVLDLVAQNAKNKKRGS